MYVYVFVYVIYGSANRWKYFIIYSADRRKQHSPARPRFYITLFAWDRRNSRSSRNALFSVIRRSVLHRKVSATMILSFDDNDSIGTGRVSARCRPVPVPRAIPVSGQFLSRKNSIARITRFIVVANRRCIHVNALYRLILIHYNYNFERHWVCQWRWCFDSYCIPSDYSGTSGQAEQVWHRGDQRSPNVRQYRSRLYYPPGTVSHKKYITPRKHVLSTDQITCYTRLNIVHPEK